MEEWKIVIVGGFAGWLPDVLRIIHKRYDPAMPSYLKSPTFFFGLALLFGIGCLASWLGQAADAKQALAYGFGAPEIVTRLAGQSEQLAPTWLSSLRNWWSY